MTGAKKTFRIIEVLNEGWDRVYHHKDMGNIISVHLLTCVYPIDFQYHKHYVTLINIFSCDYDPVSL